MTYLPSWNCSILLSDVILKVFMFNHPHPYLVNVSKSVKASRRKSSKQSLFIPVTSQLQDGAGKSPLPLHRPLLVSISHNNFLSQLTWNFYEITQSNTRFKRVHNILIAFYYLKSHSSFIVIGLCIFSNKLNFYGFM